MNAFSAITLLLACHSTPETDTANHSDVPYLGEAPAAEAPTFDANDIASAISIAMAQIPDLNAAPIIDVYTSFLDQTTDTCPQWSLYQDYPYWYDNCTTADGVVFEGYGLLVEYDEYEANDYLYTGYQLNSVATLTTTDGQTLTLSGATDLLFATNGAVNIFYSQIPAGTSWQGQSTASWLDDAASPSLYTYYTQDSSTGLRALLVDGSIAVNAGDISDVVLHDVHLLDDPSGSLCSTEPAGMVSVRNTGGQWYDLIFDGPASTAEQVPDALCDGCAVAWFQGQSLGDVCVDFSSLMDWKDVPWQM